MQKFLYNIRRSKNLVAEILGPRCKTKKKLVIDYSSPNIAKQFHIGNLRSTLIGRFLDSVNRAAGNKVISVNYIGDWGLQFALIASHWPNFKPSDEIWEKCTDLEKIKFLTDCYVEANALSEHSEHFHMKAQKTFAEMESEIVRGHFDNKYLLFWNDVKHISLRHLDEFYRQLNVNFDVTISESENVHEANELVDSLLKEGAAQLSADGLTVVPYSSNKGYAVVRKSDKSSLYLSRDLASIINRDAKYAADSYVYVVDHAQSRHFEEMKILLNAIGRKDLSKKVLHVPFGRVQGLSTRLGTTETVGEIIEKGCDQAKNFILASKTMRISAEQISEVSKNLSISTVIVNDLKRARTAEYTFSFENAFKMKQGNALLLQMKHSRLVSLERRNAGLVHELESESEFGLEPCEEGLPLFKMLKSFEDALYTSYERLEPCQVTVYLIQLANMIGKATASLRVAGEPREKALPRLLLFSAARKVLHSGMRLIGIEPLDQI